MKEIASIAALLIGIYLAFSVFLYVYQRKLIFFPVSRDPEFRADEISIDNQGTRLHGWVLNPGRPGAVIYFGGNSELITHRRDFFEDVFSEHTVYLFDYRGYGGSEGGPSEAGLFSDALAIYDSLAGRHSSVIAYGRSLGSGVAVYLATMRRLEKLILLTPYDSVAAIGQKSYPIFPVRYLIKDSFDSASRAGDIEVPVLITAAELDREIRLPHTLALKKAFTRAPVEFQVIAGAAHNDIVDFPAYRETVRDFVRPADS
jgi:pimeloyl-ACP methyl ester carboxylesterase